MSLPLPYAPWREASRYRGDGPETLGSSEHALEILSELHGELRGQPESETRHAMGLTLLATGNAVKAAELLEKALVLAPEDALLKSDLAAALLERAEMVEDSFDFVRALTAAEEALVLEPNLSEARFNRALALQKLHLRSTASRAFRSYLEADPSSSWSAEVRQRLVTLVDPSSAAGWPAAARRLRQALETLDEQDVRDLVRAYPQAAGETAELDLLPSWGRSVLHGDEETANRKLAESELLARVLTEVTLDPMVEAAVEQIHEAGSAAKRQEMARGLVALGEGRRLYEDQHYGEAAVRLAQAEAKLRSSGHVAGLWASYFRTVSSHWQGDAEAMIHRFETLARRGQEEGYLRLEGYGWWMSSYLRLNRSEISRSHTGYRRALRAFRTARQDQDTGILHVILGDVHRFLGDERAYWDHLFEALGRQGTIRRTRWLISLHEHAARVVSARGHRRTALHFLNEAVEIARMTRRPSDATQAHLLRALGYRELGAVDDAARDLEEAAAWWHEIDDPALADRLRGQLKVAEAKVWPYSAVAPDALNEALDHYAGAGYELLRAELWLERGRIHAARGEFGRAEHDFLSSIEMIERHRRPIVEERSRISYFEQAREVFDEMIRLQIDRGRDAAALSFAERARARELLEAVAPEEGWTVDPSDLTRSLPDGAVALYYASLSDRLLLWVISRGGVELERRVIGSEALARQVSELLSARNDDDAFTAMAQRLYDDLIRPARHRLAPGTSLVILPDKALHAVPFAALFNAETGRRLVEEHPFRIAPSASFLLAPARRGGAGAPPASVLVLGNPDFDRERHPRLDRLPNAAEEARRIAEIYSSARVRVLLGAQATKRRFLELGGRFEVVHFAGHAVANEEFPLLSRLLLSGEGPPGEPGELWSYELAGRDFSDTRLVVLSACSTANSRISTGEGMLSLARPFLAAGVPSVVASLWNVDDHSTSLLFQRFHRELLDGSSSAEALRAAQMDLLNAPDADRRAPDAWAAFQLYGRNVP